MSSDASPRYSKNAFPGKLVRQDPNDEPKSMLLERIRAEPHKRQKEKSPKATNGASGPDTQALLTKRKP